MNSRVKTYESEAYDLPRNVIYYIDSAWNIPLNNFVHSHLQHLQGLVNLRLFGSGTYTLCPLSIDTASLARQFLSMHPDWDIDHEEAVRSMAWMLESRERDADRVQQEGRQRRLAAGDFVCGLTTRIDPPFDSGTPAFLEADVELCTPDNFTDALLQYVDRLEDLTSPTAAPRATESAPRKSRSVFRFSGFSGFSGRACNEKCSATQQDKCMPEERMPDYDFECGSASDAEQEIVAAPLYDEAERTKSELMEELERRLALISPTDGINILLQKQFEDFFRSLETLSPRPLSPLQIDRDLHILLPGYDLEIQMLPVWKAVYILFLRHEEGIVLNRMPDYRDELARIYRSFAAGEPAQIEATIEELTTPGSDIFRQYKSKINNAFRKVLVEDLAQHYIISGTRNAPYRVQLPRDKVTIGFAVPEPRC